MGVLTAGESTAQNITQKVSPWILFAVAASHQIFVTCSAVLLEMFLQLLVLNMTDVVYTADMALLQLVQEILNCMRYIMHLG